MEAAGPPKTSVHLY